MVESVVILFVLTLGSSLAAVKALIPYQADCDRLWDDLENSPE